MKNKLIALIVVICNCIMISAQNVTNVSAEQVGKNIVVSYDLDEEADISLEVSVNGSDYQSINLMHLDGDIGTDVKHGKAKKIEWKVLDDRDSLIGNIRFRVLAKESLNHFLKRLKKAKQDKSKKVQHNAYNYFYPFNGWAGMLPLGAEYFLGLPNTNRWSLYFEALCNLPYAIDDDTWGVSISGTLGPCVKLANKFGIFVGTGFMWMHEFSSPTKNCFTMPFEIGLIFESEDGSTFTIQGYTSLKRTIGFSFGMNINI